MTREIPTSENIIYFSAVLGALHFLSFLSYIKGLLGFHISNMYYRTARTENARKF